MIEERVIVRVGKDQFDVIVGHVLNAAPLSRAEADRLVGRSPVVAAPEPVPDDPTPQPSSPPPPSPPGAEEVYGPHLPPNTRMQATNLKV
jgi:hypothetical protein